MHYCRVSGKILKDTHYIRISGKTHKGIPLHDFRKSENTHKFIHDFRISGKRHIDIHDFRISGKTHKDKNSTCTFVFILYSYIICLLQFRNFKIVYRRYAGLYFCICVDVNDNNLAYLEAIHNFVEVLNEYFHNVCELDLVFNFYKVKWCIELLNNF